MPELPAHEADALDERAFGAVDEQHDPSYLVATMEAVAGWPAVRRLRAWEQEQLALGPGDRVLDVGCGLGDVARACAALVAPGGHVVGLDPSATMLAVARARAEGDLVRVTFRVGDALAIDAPDSTFDACRAERTLQWVADPQRAVRELARVLRPSGRLCLTDTDWTTFRADLGSPAAAVDLQEAMVAFRGDGASAGARLVEWCDGAGAAIAAQTSATHTWTEWDPDREPGPPGLFPLRDVLAAPAVVAHLGTERASRLLTATEDAARAGHLELSVTMTAVAARRP